MKVINTPEMIEQANIKRKLYWTENRKYKMSEQIKEIRKNKHWSSRKK
jgi:hypothetical protein